VSDTAPPLEAGRSRAVDRLVNFTDAVVAVAITVLVLPLVDIDSPGPGETVWSVIGDNSGQVFAFLFTFYVVAIMWQTHNRILNGIRDYDGAIFWLNTTWLVAIVLLPWLSAMYGEAQSSSDARGAGGVGLLYWGTLAVISLLGSWISWHLHRVPSLLVDAGASHDRWGRMTILRGPIFAMYFLFIGVAFEIVPEVASWLPLGIIPLSIWLRPRGRQPST
jgi:uncharacterized membrane protein